MNNENQKDQQGEQPPNSHDEDLTKKKPFKWSFCPVCGTKIPEIRNLRYCMNCGLDIIYVRENNEFPENFLNKFQQKPFKPPSYMYKPLNERIDESEILARKDQKIWGLFSTFLVTGIAYVVMLFIGVLILIPFVFIYFNQIDTLLYSPYVLIVSTLVELVLIVVPVYYVGRFLKQPTLKNRLMLLGLTRKEYDTGGVMKEVLLGIIFAIGGMFLVGIVSLAMDVFVRFVFGIEFIYSSGEIEGILASADIFSLFLIVLTMLLVVGTSEEILFRGFMQKGLVRNLGAKRGIILNAVIFTFIHIFIIFTYLADSPIIFLAMFFIMFFPYFAISLMLSYLFHWRKENLIAVIIAHGLYDALTLILAFMYLNSF